MTVASTRPLVAAVAARERGPRDLERDHVHVWEVALDDAEVDEEHLWDLLTEQEQRRASRFRFANDVRRSVVTRGTLRTILGRYLDLPPGRIRFATGPRGKPALAEAEIDVRFNVTHAGSLALAAFTIGREVGVDVERAGARIDPAAIARHFFAPAEAARLDALPADGREHPFLECWTRKEAYTKALGLGLYLPLESFEVAFGPDVEPALLAAAEPADDGRRFAVIAPPTPPGYVGAVVVEKHAPDERFVVAASPPGNGHPLVYAAVRTG